MKIILLVVLSFICYNVAFAQNVKVTEKQAIARIEQTQKSLDAAIDKYNLSKSTDSMEEVVVAYDAYISAVEVYASIVVPIIDELIKDFYKLKP